MQTYKYDILKHAEELIFGDSLNQLVMKKCSTFLQCKHFSYLSTIPGFISLFHSMQNQLVQNNLPLWFSSRSFRHLFWLLSFIHPLWPFFFLSAHHLMFLFTVPHPCTCSSNDNCTLVLILWFKRVREFK